MKDILIIGAGGIGRETAWIIEEINEVKPLGIYLDILMKIVKCMEKNLMVIKF